MPSQTPINQQTQFHQLMCKSTCALKYHDYEAAFHALQACVFMAEADLQSQPLQEANMEDYCTSVILLAATELKLQRKVAACAQFADALHLLRQLYLQHSSLEQKAMIRRFEGILIRAQQTACTLSRLSHSIGESHYETDIPSTLPH